MDENRVKQLKDDIESFRNDAEDERQAAQDHLAKAVEYEAIVAGLESDLRELYGDKPGGAP